MCRQLPKPKPNPDLLNNNTSDCQSCLYSRAEIFASFPQVALYIEDTEFVAGRLNQQPCQVGKFTSTLRLRLFREFLGQMPSDCCSLADAPLPNKALSLDRHRQPGSLASQGLAKPPAPDLTDPCSDDFYKQVLLKYAAQNTRIYRERDEPEKIDFAIEAAPALEHVLASYPKYVSVAKLPCDSDAQRLDVARALAEVGCVLVKTGE